MTNSRKDLPGVKTPNFDERVRETMQVYLGHRGDPLDRGLILRDLVDANIIKLRNGYLAGSGGIPVDGLGTAVAGPYAIDLTPPPTPSGFKADAAIVNIFIEHDAPLYRQGHGHAKTVVYGATWTTGPKPTFDKAVQITEFTGTIFAHPTNPATTWYLWIKWVTVDGVESSSPAGGANGVVVTTGQDVTKLVEAMTGPGNPFTVLSVDTIKDGVTYPAGTYSTKSFIIDAQITSAKIRNLAVDDAKIANLGVSKLDAGSLKVGAFISSSNYLAGSQGFRINADGLAEFSNVVVRGTVYATIGKIGGNTIDSTGMQSPDYVKGSTGWRLDSSGSMQIAGDIVSTGNIKSKSISETFVTKITTGGRSAENISSIGGGNRVSIFTSLHSFYIDNIYKDRPISVSVLMPNAAELFDGNGAMYRVKILKFKYDSLTGAILTEYTYDSFTGEVTITAGGSTVFLCDVAKNGFYTTGYSGSSSRMFSAYDEEAKPVGDYFYYHLNVCIPASASQMTSVFSDQIISTATMLKR